MPRLDDVIADILPEERPGGRFEKGHDRCGTDAVPPQQGLARGRGGDADSRHSSSGT